MRPDTAPSFTQKDLFGGHGSVDIWNLRTMNCPPFTASLWCSLEPGGLVGRHRQQDDPELVIVLSGAGVATIGKLEQLITCGVMVYLPYGQVLSIRNTSESEPLVYLIIKARAAEE